MRLKGTIVDWKDDRGFGFIEPSDGAGRIFCHLRAFEVRIRRPVSGDKVTYEVGKDAQGRLAAVKVRPVGLEDARYQSNVRSRRNANAAVRGASSTKSASTRSALAVIYIAVSVFLATTIWLAIVGRMSFFVPIAYIAMSGITMLVYAFDKSAALNSRQRTREQTLHLLELLGGWPGAWIAQQLFRHKSRKMSFQIEFWLCVIVNTAVLIWYAGQSEWQQYL
jgi:uncharacterized membrane protein YsdA (DUF1294 family)/cold shock CspA family protein